MIHTIRIDDSTAVGAKLINELRHYPQNVEFETNTVAEPFQIPEGYMSSEEFRKTVKEDLLKRLKEDGYL